jgi:UDP-N-acetylglucosamine:LPS N-acetylglucosamine transferase
MMSGDPVHGDEFPQRAIEHALGPPERMRAETHRGNGIKLIVGASAGGHANELQILLDAARGVWPVEPAAYITTMEITARGFAQRGKPVYVIGETDRRKPLRAFAVLLRALRVALRERPEAVVTTGSLPLAIFCVWAKLLGARIVWIDSVAQIDEMSLSGRLMSRVADLCLAQWPDVAARHPNVEYAGEVL